MRPPLASQMPARASARIFAFLCLHMADFWVKMRFTDSLTMVTYAGHDEAVQDIYSRVNVAFQELWLVAVYLIGVTALCLHLIHGFQSAFFLFQCTLNGVICCSFNYPVKILLSNTGKICIGGGVTKINCIRNTIT